MRRAAAVALILTSGVSFGAPATGRTDGGVACTAQEDVRRLVELTRQGDKLAAQRLLTAQVAAGRCIVLEPGERLYLEESTVGGWVRVRRAGNPTPYWTPGPLK